MAAGAPRPNYNPFDVALTLSNAPPHAAPAQYTPGGYVPPPFALQEQPNPSIPAYQPGSYDPKPTTPAVGAFLLEGHRNSCFVQHLPHKCPLLRHIPAHRAVALRLRKPLNLTPTLHL